MHYYMALLRCVVGRWWKASPCGSVEGIAVDLCVCEAKGKEKMRQYCLLRSMVMRIGKTVVYVTEGALVLYVLE